MKIFERTCPNCGGKITYQTYSGMYNGNKNNSICSECLKLKKSIQYTGEGNPFYGKNHTTQSKEKYVKSRKNGYDKHKYKTKEFRIKQSKLNSGKNNNMFGKTFYDIWLEKFGKEIADKKLNDFRLKQSKLNSGKNNNMFGKPSPKGSGNGWSGWYNGWYFRSLLELSYMINVIERFKIDWCSAEKKKYRIKYTDYKGIERNYYPDFVLEGKYIVELKPKRLYKSRTVIDKKEGAIKFCKEHNYIYKLRTIKLLKSNEILNLYNEGKISFLNKYEEKFIKYMTDNFFI